MLAPTARTVGKVREAGFNADTVANLRDKPALQAAAAGRILWCDEASALGNRDFDWLLHFVRDTGGRLVVGFFNAYRNAERVTGKCLRDIAEQFGNWVKNRCQKWGAPILEAPEGRRHDFVDPYFRHAKKDKVVVILKAREPARIIRVQS